MTGLQTDSGALVTGETGHAPKSGDTLAPSRPIPYPSGAWVKNPMAGFAGMDAESRIQKLVDLKAIGSKSAKILQETGALPLSVADNFIENCVGTFSLPLGVATNFVIDGEDFLVPMAVEESSVVAAASHGAKLARSGGGFVTQPVATIATAQIQFYVDPSTPSWKITALIEENKEILESLARKTCHSLEARGGGYKDMQLRALPKPGHFALHVHVDTCEAMGANIVNTVAEQLGSQLPRVLEHVGFDPQKGRYVGLKILTNLCTERVAKARCLVAFDALALAGFRGEDAAKRICDAWEFAAIDPYRAVTHNKGVMNGIDAVVMATGNDWRAVEAGCHAYAALHGSYKPLTTWQLAAEEGYLEGLIEVPIALGTVGGVTRLHPTVQVALELMGFPNSRRLSSIVACVGLAQNLAALRALACEGIQKGHMALHEKNLEMIRRYDPALGPQKPHR